MTGFVVQGHKLRLKPFHCVFIPCVCSCRESSVLTSASLWAAGDCWSGFGCPTVEPLCDLPPNCGSQSPGHCGGCWFTTHWARSSATPRMLLVFLIPDVRVQTRESYISKQSYIKDPVSDFTKISKKELDKHQDVRKKCNSWEILKKSSCILKKTKLQALTLSDCIEESLIENHNKHAQNY